MQDDPNRRVARQREPIDSPDSARAMGDAIRQAFLTHMGEQQRQFAAPAAARRVGERLEGKKR
jgi:hypothetical protein